MSFIQQLKQRIRNQARRIRSNMNQETRERLDAKICERILSIPAVHAAKTIALYRSLADEVTIDGLFEHFWGAGKRCAVPLVLPESKMEMRLAQNLTTDFVDGFRHIQEPSQACKAIDPEEIDIVLVPGTCFTPEGHRLGMGAGYYDRYMSEPAFSPLKVGVAYTFQVLKSLPQEDHDLTMDMVVTDTKIIVCRGTRG